MCIQCITEAEPIARDVVPGWYLFRATTDGAPDDWPRGHFGVLCINEPLFTFAPLPPPGSDEFRNRITGFNNQWGFALDEGYRFMLACVAAGYRPESDGPVLFWFFERMYTACPAVRRLSENLPTEDSDGATQKIWFHAPVDQQR